MNNLLAAMRAVARQDEADAARLPPALIPSLSEEKRVDIVGEILRAQAREKELHRSTQPPPAIADDVTARRAAPPSRRRMSWGRGGVGVGVALAAAAVFALWVRSQPASLQSSPRSAASPESMPPFTVSASGGVAETRAARSETDAPDSVIAPAVRLRAESELRVTCRPDVAVVGPVAVRAFFVLNGAASEVHPALRIAGTGAAELRLRGSDLLGAHSGQGQLRIAIGRPARVAEMTVGSARAVTSDDAGARWLTVPVDLEGPSATSIIEPP